MTDSIFLKTLIGVMAAAFMAWSAVIWRAVEQVGDLYSDIQLIKQAVAQVSADVTDTHQSLTRHEQLPAHPGAQVLHERTMILLQQMQRDIDKAEKRHP